MFMTFWFEASVQAYMNVRTSSVAYSASFLVECEKTLVNLVEVASEEKSTFYLLVILVPPRVSSFSIPTSYPAVVSIHQEKVAVLWV